MAESLVVTDSKTDHRDDVAKLGIRLFSANEINILVKMFIEESGLRRDQFATNMWGYPFIPIPEVRDMYGRVRLAPKNVSNDYLGHPIYWIDPHLTVRYEGETEECWSIRMFYLIDALGYWDQEIKWVDFLAAHEIELTDREIITYHVTATPQIAKIDNIELMSENDFENDYTLDDMERYYQSAMTRCAKILDAEVARSALLQAKYYRLAQKLIGDALYDPNGAYDSEGSIWRVTFMPQLLKIMKNYHTVLKDYDNKKGALPLLYKQMKHEVDRIITCLNVMNKTYSFLKVSVEAGHVEQVNGVIMSMMLDQLSALNVGNGIMDSAYAVLSENISDVFARHQSFEAIKDEYRIIRREYKRAWNRVRLALANYERWLDDKEPYPSLNIMMQDLSAKATGSSFEEQEKARQEIEAAVRAIEIG